MERKEVMWFGEMYVMRSFMFSILHVIILDLLNQAELNGCCMKLSWGRWKLEQNINPPISKKEVTWEIVMQLEVKCWYDRKL